MADPTAAVADKVTEVVPLLLGLVIYVTGSVTSLVLGTVPTVVGDATTTVDNTLATVGATLQATLSVRHSS